MNLNLKLNTKAFRLVSLCFQNMCLFLGLQPRVSKALFAILGLHPISFKGKTRTKLTKFKCLHFGIMKLKSLNNLMIYGYSITNSGMGEAKNTNQIKD